MSKRSEQPRNVIFSPMEVDKLVTLVEARKQIITTTECCNKTWQEKDKAWKAIEKEFNNAGLGVFRSSRQLKIKYKTLKISYRKKVKKGSKLTQIDRRIWDLMVMTGEGLIPKSRPDPKELCKDSPRKSKPTGTPRKRKVKSENDNSKPVANDDIPSKKVCLEQDCMENQIDQTTNSQKVKLDSSSSSDELETGCSSLKMEQIDEEIKEIEGKENNTIVPKIIESVFIKEEVGDGSSSSNNEGFEVKIKVEPMEDNSESASKESPKGVGHVAIKEDPESNSVEENLYTIIRKIERCIENLEQQLILEQKILTLKKNIHEIEIDFAELKLLQCQALREHRRSVYPSLFD